MPAIMVSPVSSLYSERKEVLATNGDQRVAKLLAVIGGLRLNRHRDDGVKCIRSRMMDLFRAQRVSSHGVLETNHGDDLSGFTRVNCVAVLGVHFEDWEMFSFLLLPGFNRREPRSRVPE